MKYCTLLITVFAWLCCGACAQQQSAVLPGTSNEKLNEDVSAEEVDLAEEMDLLLDDDFDDLNEGVSEQPSCCDPLEPMNRVFFAFNDKLYYWVLKPVNSAYSAVLPVDFRLVIGNFITNLAAPVRLLNNLLQGKVNDAGIVLSRFVINSTLGVFGLGDAAYRFGLEPKPEDFGQTLGVWGVGEGVYFCWPVIGPSTVRDTLGFVGDAYAHPMVHGVDDIAVSAGYYAGNKINLLSLNPDVYEDLKKYSLDPYVSMRQVYLDYRRNKVDDRLMLEKNDNEL